ncbi:hypothetical protein DU002_06105 [Corallincola holothuriorum]|uniref:Uncharacterized protein n=1 Tax=Corallincola holothuriorum TaxID=2282215 RepID=A0A368NL59_9GAMM|nr:hypothetical protein [Corallincola holothuriorum]RCU50896.1 hypothetical protein DU002_06105 [Corallincola holothuriorum]
MTMYQLTPLLAARAADYSYSSRQADAKRFHQNVPGELLWEFDFEGGLVSGISCQYISGLCISGCPVDKQYLMI